MHDCHWLREWATPRSRPLLWPEFNLSLLNRSQTEAVPAQEYSGSVRLRTTKPTSQKKDLHSLKSPKVLLEWSETKTSTVLTNTQSLPNMVSGNTATVHDLVAQYIYYWETELCNTDKAVHCNERICALSQWHELRHSCDPTNVKTHSFSVLEL